LPDSAGDTADYTISGVITNAEGYPMPYMLVEANISKENMFTILLLMRRENISFHCQAYLLEESTIL